MLQGMYVTNRQQRRSEKRELRERASSSVWTTVSTPSGAVPQMNVNECIRWSSGNDSSGNRGPLSPPRSRAHLRHDGKHLGAPGSRGLAQTPPPSNNLVLELIHRSQQNLIRSKPALWRRSRPQLRAPPSLPGCSPIWEAWQCRGSLRPPLLPQPEKRSKEKARSGTKFNSVGIQSEKTLIPS